MIEERVRTMAPRILAVIPTLADDPTETIESLMRQTVGVSKILVAVGSRVLYQKLVQKYAHAAERVEFVYVKPNLRDPLGKRVAAKLNRALSKVRLEMYDYLLRVDADTILPESFIEENLKADADCVGMSGCTMLLKMDSFIKIFGGRFAEVGAEDTYTVVKLLIEGRSVKPRALPPKLKRRGGAHHSWRYFFDRGVERYRLGYEPVHVIGSVLHDIRNLFTIIGYAAALLRGMKRYDTAYWVFRAQLKSLVRGKRDWMEELGLMRLASISGNRRPREEI